VADKKQKTSDSMTIGRNMRKLRLQKGYSQKELGEMLGVSFQQIQKYETGKNRLPSDRLYRLQSIYRVPFMTFFENIEPCLPAAGVSAERALQKFEQIAAIVNTP
jgi:transcriptional regulator with XRE-family HTH domain